MDPTEFVNTFKNMPTNFVPSFSEERWNKLRSNLPSSVFKAQVDPRTLLWKDTRSANNKGFSSDGRRQNLKDIGILPFATTEGGLILVNGASGVPLPRVGERSSFKDEDIVKRAIRFSLEETTDDLKNIVHNII
mmetsp:Transcript_16478/g.25433  ORF Transcript_16478/g.25433 Transcript_16478/m.25433 type:complete len:134 (-) Transcript_16478:1060-1461(-)